ncbi:MAG: hypothetical protein GY805_20255 [Chloroflexi bacterium]|nr:hypothetical protein [Chloroflexota bacterium]
MSSTPDKKKNSTFSKIESRTEALKVIKESSITFMVVGMILGAFGFFLFPETLMDAALYIILGLVLMFVKSRIAAVLLLLLSGVSVVTTFMNRLGITAVGGRNIFLAILVFWAAVKAVEATFKLHGKFAQESKVFMLDPQTLLISEQLDHQESRFTTMEWVLVGLAGLLVVVLLGVVLFVFIG